jgi:hypothetical protein
LLFLNAVLANSAFAATQSTWPCIQRKVPEIALSAVWTIDPPGEAAKTWKNDREIADLVARLAARRTELPEAEKLIGEYAAKAGPDKQAKLQMIFQGLFETLNAERGDVIDGIERYGEKQIALADKLRKQQEALAAKRADAKADAGEVQDMDDQLVWNTRIFDERRKSLSYVCEVPVLIEQRLFELSRSIQAALK